MSAAVMPSKPTGLYSERFVVTPKEASYWLTECNPRNRPISTAVVKRYAEDMRAGRWQYTHQGPAFDTEGNLIDGQHRLRAVVASGMSVPMHITWNANAETYAVLDTGWRRSPSHVVPGPNAGIKAGAARFLCHPPRLLYGDGFRNDDAVRIVEQYGDSLAVAATLASRIYANTKINTSLMCALLTLAIPGYGARQTRGVDDWVEGLTTGVGLGPTDPRLHLRNRWVADAKILNGGNGRLEAAYLLTRAWNAYVHNEAMHRLQLPRNAALITRDRMPEVDL